jgi:excisionase family DNA binding protein
MSKQFLTPTEVATLLSVSPVTVRQWAQKGLLEARTTAGGHRRFPVEAVRKLAAEMGMTLPVSADANPRLLIVDDDQQINRFLVTLFTKRYPGLAVSAAFDGFDAGVKVQRIKPTVVLLDVMMPGIDGVEVCRVIKADPETQGTRVIAMTGHYTPELERRIRAAGAEQLLKKPFSTEEVLAACALDLETPD